MGDKYDKNLLSTGEFLFDGTDEPVQSLVQPLKAIPSWLKDSKYSLDFITLLKTIYGDNELNDRTLKQLSNTWKTNPSFIINVANQKTKAAKDAELQKRRAIEEKQRLARSQWNLDNAKYAVKVEPAELLPSLKETPKPEVKPVLKPKVDWNAKAVEGMGAGTTRDDVLNWQKYYNSLNSGKKGFAALSEDGLFGLNTKTAYDAWKNSAAGKQYNTMTAKGATWDAGSRSWKLPKVAELANLGVYDFGSGKYISNEEYNNGLMGIKSENNTPPVVELQKTPTFQGADSYAFEYTMQNDFDKLYNKHLGGKYNSNYHGIDQISLRKDAGYLDAWNAFRSQYQKGNIWMNGLMNHYTRLEKGGNINKFSNGGKQMNDKELQEAFVQFLILDAQALGIDPNDQQAMERYLQSLGKEGIAAKLKEFMQKMKGNARVAALGTKLDYINKLKGNCPEGEELVYMKKGGRVCPVCQKKAEKASSGTNLKQKNAISDFKEKRHINPSDTVHVNGQPRTLTDSQNKPLVKGMKSYSASEYLKDMKDAKKGKKDAARRVEKSDMKTAYGCGNKLRKDK